MNAKKITIGVMATTVALTGGVVPALDGLGITGSEQVVQASEVQGDYEYKDNGNGTATITAYKGGETDVTIPREIDGLTVTNIGESAFEYDKFGGPVKTPLTSITIPEGVTTIENSAFDQNNLTEVTLPSSVMTIGKRAFTGNNITKINLPNNLRVLDDYSFYGNQITEIKLPESLVKIGKRGFHSNNLKGIIIPSSVSEIGGGAFARNNELTDVTILSKSVKFGSPLGDEKMFSNPYVTFYGYEGSTAQDFAQKEGYLFKIYEEPIIPEPDENGGNGSGNGDSEGSSDGNTENGGSHLDKATFNLISGGLSLKSSPIKSFGDIEIGNETKTYETSFENPFNLKDFRGTQEGWKVSVSAEPFKVAEPNGGFAEGTEAHELPSGTLSLKPIANLEEVGDESGELPKINLTENTVIDNGSVEVLSAKAGTGSGEYSFEFEENPLELTINPKTIKVDAVNYPNGVTPYESVITWDLVQAP